MVVSYIHLHQTEKAFIGQLSQFTSQTGVAVKVPHYAICAAAEEAMECSAREAAPAFWFFCGHTFITMMNREAVYEKTIETIRPEIQKSETMRDSDLIRKFKDRYNKDIIPFYQDREDRNRWAASIMKTFPGKKLLNLGGGGKRHLAKHLGSQWSVHEVDITGDCDTKLNLDEIERLPFDDNFFDTCCAFEALEHLENFHLVADEMYRVSKSTIFISLPNAATGAYRMLQNQKTSSNPLENGVYNKFYGLPLKVPKDRHRWWFTFEDIIRYFLWIEEKQPCTVEFYVPQPDTTVKRKLFRLILGDRIFLNFFCTNVWIKIDKK